MTYTDVRAKMCAPFVRKSYSKDRLIVGQLYQARCPVCVFVNRVMISLGTAERVDTCDHYMRVYTTHQQSRFGIRFSRKETS